MLKKKLWIAAAATVLVLPTIASAHPGHETESGFGQGLMHPLGGLDHLLALIGIALLAVRLGGRHTWRLPLAFLGSCVIGGAIAQTGISIPFTEWLIMASVVIGGGLLACGKSVPGYALASLAALGTVHGFAHIQEMGTAPWMSYSLGLILASTAVIAITMTSAVALRALRTRWVATRSMSLPTGLDQ
ncbi:HupE/UreJ family protein [Stieleria sp. TO1_6]|uniref:HupE/UreJ family protein n=1 Tax=Stieleria tagensis TaxID=2956795 RepID=UPI00209B2733|nr:HupE/UreJ family protein [Stieleria tagensis]MCO8121153.1 HupE/UreJ family protein [Stieleria tagensis]